MSQLPNETSIPFAQFRFSGETVTMNQRQFDQAIRDARLCHCHRCLVCRAAEYAKDNGHESAR